MLDMIASKYSSGFGWLEEGIKEDPESGNVKKKAVGRNPPLSTPQQARIKIDIYAGPSLITNEDQKEQINIVIISTLQRPLNFPLLLSSPPFHSPALS